MLPRPCLSELPDHLLALVMEALDDAWALARLAAVARRFREPAAEQLPRTVEALVQRRRRTLEAVCGDLARVLRDPGAGSEQRLEELLVAAGYRKCCSTQPDKAAYTRRYPRPGTCAVELEVSAGGSVCAHVDFLLLSDPPGTPHRVAFDVGPGGTCTSAKVVTHVSAYMGRYARSSKEPEPACWLDTITRCFAVQPAVPAVPAV